MCVVGLRYLALGAGSDVTNGRVLPESLEALLGVVVRQHFIAIVPRDIRGALWGLDMRESVPGFYGCE